MAGLPDSSFSYIYRRGAELSIYRGLEKQKAKVNMVFALANLIIADWRRAVAA